MNNGTFAKAFRALANREDLLVAPLVTREALANQRMLLARSGLGQKPQTWLAADPRDSEKGDKGKLVLQNATNPEPRHSRKVHQRALDE